MDWTDPKSRWQQKIRRQRATLVAMSAATPLLAIGFIAMVELAMATVEGFGLAVHLIILTVPALASVVTIVSGVQHTRRYNRILRVPAANGMVCPLCANALAVDGESGRCDRCQWDCDPEKTETLVEFWSSMPYLRADEMLKYTESLELPQKRGARVIWWFLRSDATKRQKVARLAVGLGAALVVFFLVGLALKGSAIAALAYALPVVLFMAVCGFAGSLIGSSVAGKRTGDGIHCVECGYQKVDDSSAECPECGADWSHHGTTVRGEWKGRRPVIAIVGIVLIIIVMPVIVGGTGGGIFSLFDRLIPTSVLIEQAGADDLNGFSAREELASRTLTPDETVELATVLVASYEQGIEPPFVERQIDSLIVSGHAPQTVVNRYLRRLVRPKTVRLSTNDDGTLSLEAKGDGSSMTTLRCGLVIERVEVNGVDVSHRLPSGSDTRVIPGLYRVFEIPVSVLGDDTRPESVTVTGWIVWSPIDLPESIDVETAQEHADILLVDPIEFTSATPGP